MSHSTKNRSFRRRVFPANHLAMVLTKQTYNTQHKRKKPNKRRFSCLLRHPARKQTGSVLCTIRHKVHTVNWASISITLRIMLLAMSIKKECNLDIVWQSDCLFYISDNKFHHIDNAFCALLVWFLKHFTYLFRFYLLQLHILWWACLSLNVIGWYAFWMVCLSACFELALVLILSSNIFIIVFELSLPCNICDYYTQMFILSHIFFKVAFPFNITLCRMLLGASINITLYGMLPGGGAFSWLFQMTRTLARLGASATCWMILYNESRRS